MAARWRSLPQPPRDGRQVRHQVMVATALVLVLLAFWPQEWRTLLAIWVAVAIGTALQRVRDRARGAPAMSGDRRGGGGGPGT